MISTTDREAFRWWNNLLQRCNLDIIPNCVPSDVMFKTLKQIAPIFETQLVSEDDDKGYWTRLWEFLNKFSDGVQIPHPSKNFDKFIIFLYSIRKILNPQTSFDCKMLLDKLHPDNPCRFFLTKFQSFITSPNLYLETLLHFKDTNDPIWILICEDQRILEYILELYIDYLSPLDKTCSDDAWYHHLIIVEIIYSLLDENKAYPNNFQYTQILIDSLIQFLESSPFQFSVSYLRYLFILIQSTQSKTPKDVTQARVIKLLQNVNRNCDTYFFIAYTLLSSLNLPYFTNSQVVKIMCTNTKPNISYIENILAVADNNTCVQCMSYLAKLAIYNKVWIRAVFSKIKIILSKFSPSKPEIREWFIIFVRKLFIFIALASHKMKYRNRTLLLCETLSSFLDCKVMWITHTILNDAATVATTKMVPLYFKSFFQLTSPINDLTLSEFEAFSHSSVRLKTFPFDPEKGTLMIPPLTEVVKRNRNPKVPIKSSSSCRIENPMKTPSTPKRNSNNLPPPTPSHVRKKSDPRIAKPNSPKPIRLLASSLYVTPRGIY